MAILCSLKFQNDYAVVTASEASLGMLKFDMTPGFCRIYESSHQQTRDYTESLLQWCGDEQPSNLDVILSSLQMCVHAKRHQVGLV